MDVKTKWWLSELRKRMMNESENYGIHEPAETNECI